MAAIPIGGDPDDFDAIRAHPGPAAPLLDPSMINLSYVGAFLPRAGPLARVLFQALRGLRRSQPELAARLRLHFIGTSNQPDDHGAFRVQPIAREEGVGDLVVETPRRALYLEALQILADSHGLLLIGSDEPHYTASKIYPALMSGRPYVSLFHRASSSHAILQAAGGGGTFCFSDADELRALEAPLRDALARLASDPQAFGRCDPAAYAGFTADGVSRAFAAVLDAARSRGGAC